MSKPGTLATLVNIFAAPGEAFAVIKERATFFVPLVLICLAASTVNWLYSSEVDIGWLTEQQLRTQTFLDLTDAQIEQMANQAAERGRGGAIATSVIGTIVFVTVVMLVQALYLKIVSAFRKDRVRYRQWLSLVCWSSLPAILGSIAAIVLILTSDVTFMPQTEINPLSFANLVGLDQSQGSSALSVLSNLSPVNIWSLALMILGHRALTSSGLTTSAAVILAPAGIIVGLIVALI